MRLLAAALLSVSLAASQLMAQTLPGIGRTGDVVTKIESRFEPATAKPGDRVTWRLTLVVNPGWHVYATRQADASSSNVTDITFPNTLGLRAISEVVDPPEPKLQPDIDGGEPLKYFEGLVKFERTFEVTKDAPAGALPIEVAVQYIACNEKRCLPPKRVKTTATLTIEGGTAAAAPPTRAPLEPVPPPTPTQPETATPATSLTYRAELESILARIQTQKSAQHSGLWQFLLTAVFWGGVSLFTPCVFPMIPITVSFFLKQSEKNHSSPVKLALVYCGTIIVVLGAASLTLLGFFTALSITPAMNIAIGVLFVVLALSLFGMYDLTLPASLTRFTSSREGRGGIVGTIFMALTFTVVSFTCVAPFLGGFGGMAASGQYPFYQLVLGALAFASTFAAPFFLLALFPSLIRKLPQSGSWLHTVKVVMGFVELAAAMKFFRTAELIAAREATFFTYDLVLGSWVVLSVLCGLYLVRIIRVGDHDLASEGGVSVSRLLFGTAFVTLGLYLLPALFAGGPDGGNQRPRGAVFAWVDSFLLPEPGDSSAGDLQWTSNLKRAIEEARNESQRTNRPARVFIDFTGETCTNCKFNERTVFSRGPIKELFQKYRLVQLYTDKVPDRFYPTDVRATLQGTARQRADAELNRWFQEQAFGDIALPMYVILEPHANGAITVVDKFEGKINDVGEFAEFLKDRGGPAVVSR